MISYWKWKSVENVIVQIIKFILISLFLCPLGMLVIKFYLCPYILHWFQFSYLCSPFANHLKFIHKARVYKRQAIFDFGLMIAKFLWSYYGMVLSLLLSLCRHSGFYVITFVLVYWSFWIFNQHKGWYFIYGIVTLPDCKPLTQRCKNGCICFYLRRRRRKQV